MYRIASPVACATVGVNNAGEQLPISKGALIMIATGIWFYRGSHTVKLT
jgi:hypothetical protein